MSKFCSILSYPLREYERKKTLKIYKEVVCQNPEEGDRFIPNSVAFI